MVRRIALLGSTGSIGRQTLEVIAGHPDRMQVVALSAWTNLPLLEEQLQATGATRACALTPPPHSASPRDCRWYSGSPGLLQMLADAQPEVVVNAISGAAGLAATLQSIQQGAHLAIANKESLVVAGELILAEARRRGIEVIPIDSEHSAILQCLRAGKQGEVRRIVLTASGGPFRGWSQEELALVTPEQALRHPTWSMGAKISIDSATLMNKGLELLEAQVLFGLPEDRIEVVVHPQSIVHSLVEFHDGSILAQLGPPDMRIPIQYALSAPERWHTPSKSFSLIQAGRFDFEALDDATFPALTLARRASRQGGSARVVLNAANEVAVDLFLRRRIPFPSICALVERSLNEHQPVAVDDLAQIAAVDRHTREILNRWI